MSNQYRVEENRDLVCVVDTGRLMASPVGAMSRVSTSPSTPWPCWPWRPRKRATGSGLSPSRPR